MKVLWLCCLTPSVVQKKLTGGSGGALWVEHVLADMRKRENTHIRVLSPGAEASGQLDQRTSYTVFVEEKAYEYSPRLEALFVRELEDFCPDIIHIWGAEYGHALAMVNAAKQAGMEQRVVISIQGLCSVYARHFCEGLPASVCRRFSFRDALRRDNIALQRRKYVLRGQMEKKALEQTTHIIGRTDWDKAVTGQYNPERVYHFCNETLRPCFYEGVWNYSRCIKHRIFASNYLYTVKGFHYLLEAFCIVLQQYPDATIAVPGESLFPDGWKGRLRQQYYHRYLADFAREHGLQDKIFCLGDNRTGEQMKQALLEANVFAMPSTVENSPNSLGEAMLLGVPCVAADVGGISNLLHAGEGYVYQSTAPYMLAHYIMEVFRQEERAETMGALARAHAMKTHDPKQNMEDLMTIYREIAGKE